VKYQERFGEPAPEGFRTLHVHDLRHTVGRRLRAAGVALETRQAILGHKSRSITTHYSAAELRELLDAMEFIATDNLRESHALTLLKRKAGYPMRRAKPLMASRDKSPQSGFFSRRRLSDAAGVSAPTKSHPNLTPV
jgi:hypothetical protein